MKWLWLLAVVTVVSADTVRLHDGTVLEGNILAESETELSLELSLSRGTIFKTQVIPKSNVASFARWTPEQKQVVAMQRAYQALTDVVPPVDTNVSVAACDRAIGELQAFLNTFPGSSHVQEIADRLAQWQADRGKVAAGMAKVEGEWITKEEAELRQRRAQIQLLAKRANDAFTAKQWAQAVRTYDALLALEPGGVTEQIATRQIPEALTAWRVELEPQLRQLESELAAAQHRLDQAQRVKASQKQSQPKLSQSTGDKKLGSGDAGGLMRAQSEVTFAESQVNALRAPVEKLRGQLAEINRRLTVPAPTVPTARETAPPSTDVLQDTASWWEKYWMIFVGIGIVSLWLLSKIVAR